MNRTDHATQTITDGAYNGLTVRINCSDEWLGFFPGGFAPIPRAAGGLVFEICPERIVAVSEALTDEEFTSFCLAILTWQNETLLNFGMQHDPELIVMEFADRFPEHIATLLMVADDHDLPLVDFLGARRTSGSIQP